MQCFLNIFCTKCTVCEIDIKHCMLYNKNILYCTIPDKYSIQQLVVYITYHLACIYKKTPRQLRSLCYCSQLRSYTCPFGVVIHPLLVQLSLLVWYLFRNVIRKNIQLNVQQIDQIQFNYFNNRCLNYCRVLTLCP